MKIHTEIASHPFLSCTCKVCQNPVAMLPINLYNGIVLTRVPAKHRFVKSDKKVRE